jgi:hypothetical protein
MGERRTTYILFRKIEGKNHSEDLRRRWIISGWISGKWGGKVETECIWLRIGTSGGLL